MADQPDPPSKLGMIAGATIGVLWIAMAGAALFSAIDGWRDGRPDFFLGWLLVGVLLLAAGCAAIIGSWWHANRVLRQHH